MEKKQKGLIIGITSLLLITLILVGLTYAYYRTRIIGNNSEEPSISVTSKKLEITYKDGTSYVSMEGRVEPGFVYKKQFSVENTGDTKTYYSIVLDNVINGFNKGERVRGKYNDWTYKLYNSSSIEESNLTTANLIKEGSITTDNYQVIKDNIEIVANDTEASTEYIHNYVLVITYENLTDIDQSADMGQEFSLRVNIANEGNLTEVLGEIAVGDKVNYTYLNVGESTRTYTTSGEETFEGTPQTFDVAGNHKVESWKVFKASEEGILLISDLPATVTAENGLNLYGSKGYENASEILNSIGSLYSSQYGEGRSISADDIISAVGTRTEVPYYTNESSIRIANATSATDLTGQMTIKEIELASVSTDVKNNISKNRLAIGDVAFDDIIPYNFQIREDDVFRDNPTLKAIIFEGTNSSEENFQAPYWVDGKIIDVNFAKDQVKFRVNFLQHAGLGSRHFWNNLEGDQEDLKTIYYIVRPIVKLNTNLHMEKDTTTGEWNIIG